jgi:hypothetical protein
MAFHIIQGTADADVVNDFEAGVDRVMIAARLTGDMLAPGHVESGLYAIGEAAGSLGQFVYDDPSDPNMGRLYWDANGADADGAALLALFAGKPTLAVADLFVL